MRRVADALEAVNVPPVYAPRVLLASRRTVGDLLDTRPFDTLGSDASALEQMTIPTGDESSSQQRYDSIEDRSRLLQKQLSKLEGWWSYNGESPIGTFAGEANRAAGIEARGGRPTATPAQLERAVDYERRVIAAYCRRKGIAPPRAQYRPEEPRMANAVDANGERVISFTGKVRNLARVAELTNAVVDIATSGVWREYKTAVGRERWRDAELDYFLIACDMHYDDVSRVLAWNAQAKELAPMMDADAGSEHRRSLEQASEQWHPPTGETLLDRARRLGWLRDNGMLRRSPIPRRARAQAKHGMTYEQHATRTRPERIPPPRRKALDEIAERLRQELADEHERRYVVERLARDGGGRPATTAAEKASWRADAEELGWNTGLLAERWKLSDRGARRRIERLRAPDDEA